MGGVESIDGHGIRLRANNLAWQIGYGSHPGTRRIRVEQVGRRSLGDAAKLVPALFPGHFEAHDRIVPNRASLELGEQVGLVEQYLIDRVARLRLRPD